MRIAEALGKSSAAREFAQAQDEFRRDFYASVRSAAEVHGISYVPGAADLGDFDATSTTIALAPAGEEHNVPDELLRATFERYWRNFTDRRDGKESWDAYTPYELRVAGSFVRLGWRERAHELFDYFFMGPAACGLEPVGRGRRPRAAANPASSATCRTRGSPPTTSARRSTCSLTSGRATSRWCWRQGFPTIGSRARALRQRTCAHLMAR